MTAIHQHTTTGIILAGGKSTRMGQEKGLMYHINKPFIQHIIEALENITNQIIIVTSNAEYQKFGYLCIEDIIPDKGPLGGIYTGLTNSKTSTNIILSCDIPFITSAVLHKLILNHSVAYDITMYENMPLIGIYHKSLAKLFLNKIETKQLKLQKVISELNVQPISITTGIMPYLKNINTQQQYKDAII